MQQSLPLDPHGWCSAFLSILPVDHVAVSTLGDPFEVAIVAASDATAVSLTQTQLDRGVGLCWEAKTTGQPVLVPRLVATPVWSDVLSTTSDEQRIGSAYALPLTLGDLVIGAVSLYARAADVLSATHLAAAREPTAMVSLQVLHDAVQSRDDPDAAPAAGRRVVHQATGMVMAQTRVSADDALVLIRGRAYVASSTVHEVAVAIVDRRITFID